MDPAGPAHGGELGAQASHDEKLAENVTHALDVMAHGHHKAQADAHKLAHSGATGAFRNL